MKKTVIILISALFVLVTGTAVAYKNTASLGYDSAELISIEGKTLSVMGCEIDLLKVKKKAETALEKWSSLTSPIL